ncbi:energy-coupling factor ABC transporter permease [Euzebya tangerina]|uniref:energy-coupling factor ABC transporter permease n=1 Tax=Euzebya tangerina TaxID=591198 RepID=UPI000E30E409|nr:energy-coupling factor ABC transporter permease [Euzebya tangerina]
MHAPDGFLTAGTAVATGVISTSAIGVSVAKAKETIKDKQVPLAGIAAAFIFAAQMFNFPVAAGTTGHLLGGALAAILLGPSMGAIVVSVVVIVQALGFADGGLTALGYNVFNMAIVTAFGGYAAFRLLRRVFPANAAGVIAASGIAAGLSVVFSAMAFSIQWLFGASAPVPFDTVFGAMVGVHLLIGIGEGIITGLAIGAVMAARPDLVYGARDLDRTQMADRPKVGAKAFIIAGVLVSVLFATVVSQFAVDNPDGLERVAEDEGFIEAGEDHALDSFIFSDYATAGVGNETLSLALAGLVGVIVTGAVGLGLAIAVRDRRAAEPADLPDESVTPAS